MKWIKASERLPDSKRYYNCTIQGMPTVFWIDKKNESIVNSQGETIDKSMWDEIKWLDETESPKAEGVEESVI